MSITNLLWFLIPVLALQIVMFFVIRQKKKKMRKNDILAKYGISNRSDLFKMLQNPHLTDEDRNKLQNIYESRVLG
jgi:cytochrome c-type biogenesis protein CcmH/NrfF